MINDIRAKSAVIKKVQKKSDVIKKINPKEALQVKNQSTLPSSSNNNTISNKMKISEPTQTIENLITNTGSRNNFVNKQLQTSNSIMTKTNYSKSKKVISQNHNSRNLLNTSNHLRNSMSMNSKNEIKSTKLDLNRMHTEFDEHVSALEKLISGIKYEGFEKTKLEVQNRMLVKQEYEVRNKNLQNQLNYLNSIRKKIGTKDLVNEQNAILHHNTKERIKMENNKVVNDLDKIRYEIELVNF